MHMAIQQNVKFVNGVDLYYCIIMYVIIYFNVHPFYIMYVRSYIFIWYFKLGIKKS